jgi:hypothetical protein
VRYDESIGKSTIKKDPWRQGVVEIPKAAFGALKIHNSSKRNE